jgi:hypothetical protein
MQIQIKVESPRWLRLPRRRSAKLGVALVAALVVAVPVAWASHNFTDVPDSNPHHADIAAVYGARITTGCTPTTYCPGDAVTRQTMATFLRRAMGRAAYAAGNDVTLSDGLTKDLAVASIVAGGAAGGTGFVKVDATGHGWQNAGSIGPVRLSLQVVRDGGGSSRFNYATLMPTAAGQPNPNATSAVTWLVAVPTGTTQTFRLKGTRDWGTGPLIAQGQITLTYLPFGSAGTATLSDGAAGDVTPTQNLP